MAASSLPQLPPTLLERIVSKFEAQSYFRLQRTCRGMLQFIRSSQKIRVYMEDDLDFASCLASSRFALYGIRFASFTPSADLLDKFDRFCDNVKAYQITCSDIYIYGCPELTKDHCAALFDALKPSEIFLHSEGTDQFQACSSLTGVSKLILNVDVNDVIPSIHLLTNSHTKVELAADGRNTNVEVLGEILIEVGKALQDTRLCCFSFVLTWDNPPPPVDKVLEKWSEFHPILQDEPKTNLIVKTSKSIIDPVKEFRCLLDPARLHYFTLIMCSTVAYEGVYVNSFGKMTKNVVLQWGEMPSSAYISTGQIMGWGNKAIEIRSVDTGHLDGVFMHKKAQKLKFLAIYSE